MQQHNQRTRYVACLIVEGMALTLAGLRMARMDKARTATHRDNKDKGPLLLHRVVLAAVVLVLDVLAATASVEVLASAEGSRASSLPFFFLLARRTC